MSQVGAVAASLGPPRRHRDVPQDSTNSTVGTSISVKFGETEWEAKESQRQRELEEARARAAQMEKTMKWWSDCTANWREKWSKVRNERNKARDEAKQLRASLEAALKESNSHKREKNDLEMQITQLKKEMEKIHMLLMKHAGQFHKSSLENNEDSERDRRDINCSPDISSDGLKNVNSEDGLVTKTAGYNNDSKDLDIEEYILQGAVPKNQSELLTEEESAEEKRLIQQLSKDDFDEDYLLQKISMLELRLDEAQKTIQMERDEKNILQKNNQKVSSEMQEFRTKYEDLRAAKQDAVRELLTLQEQHRAEIRILNNSLQEEVSSRENLERRLCELRTELERLQSENASEWGKRERLETEKLGLERDNKKLRAEIRDMQERYDKKGRPLSNTDVEVRALQQELAERNKEVGEIKYSHTKLKKLLSEANTELGHAVRRAEQYETEVKRLRARVEELKRQLSGAEDELDAACNQVRRLQRSNEELTGQTEGLQVQIQHLQTRGSISPRQQNLIHYNNSGQSSGSACNKTNVTMECKPSINDLRQIFDDSRHCFGNNGESKRSLNSVEKSNSNFSYYDAKQTHLEDNIFESKSSRNINFERVKQKFDNPNQHHNQREIFGSKILNYSNNHNKSGNSGKIGITDLNGSNHHQMQINKHNLNDAIQVFDEPRSSLSKRETFSTNSINLDDLKVSEDEDANDEKVYR